MRNAHSRLPFTSVSVLGERVSLTVFQLQRSVAFQDFTDGELMGGLQISSSSVLRQGRVIQHFEITLRTASSPDRRDELYWIHLDLAEKFLEEGRFDTARAHVKSPK